MDSYCRECGAQVEASSPRCDQCGTIQDSFVYKSRIAAASLAMFAGVFGFHRFFLGQWWGIFYLLLCWTYLPWLVGIIEGIVFLATSQEKWNKKYNQGISAGSEKGTVLVVVAVLFPLIAIIGILAAIAIPAYLDFTIRAKLAPAHQAIHSATQAVEAYTIREQAWPADNATLGLSTEPVNSRLGAIRIEGGVIHLDVSSAAGTSGSIIYVPKATEQGIQWSCSKSTIPRKYLPTKCR
ncbi:pilin [Dongshaea marina]|uniref:pilin n=1 Tax=Dongshaea marina TaxID=2047966 RepID=UPI00131F4301|nr:pilin [Dongshaea marina]